MKLSKFVPLFLATLFFSSNSIHAQVDPSYKLSQEDLISAPLTINPGQSVSVSLSTLRDIEKIHVDAFGISQNAMFEVVVNGDVKGTIFVPGQDPSYVVTIADISKSIEFRHLSGAAVRITSVKIEYNISSGEAEPSHGERDEAAALTRRMIRQASEFQAKISSADFKTYILPIKIAAGHSHAIATASGDLSRRLHKSLAVIVEKYDFSKSFLDSLMSEEALFEDCVQMLEMYHELKELID